MTNQNEDRRVYHPHRIDGLDRNLTRLNEADYRVGYRCTCSDCLTRYEDSRKWAESVRVMRGKDCSHNVMVARPNDPLFAWQCAECGHVYGRT